jgi:vitamin B12 transporter
VKHVLFLLALPLALNAQRDTTALEKVIVTAERARSTLGKSTAAVTRLEGADLKRVPHATVADMLRLVPGIAVVDYDGRGGEPQIMARGFYGGGEAEYVVVLVDGKPVDQLHTGLVQWEALPPLSAIQAIEVVRGGHSALYGSGAIGAVINIITAGTTGARLTASGGTFSTLRLDGSLGAFAAAVEHTDGYRDHAKRTIVRGRGGVRLAPGISLGGAANWREWDDPGALRESLMALDRRQSDPLFRFDQTRDYAYTVTLNAQRGARSGWLRGNVRRTDAIRTLVLAPDFGDTKQRVADNRRLQGGVQYQKNAFTAGIEANYGTIDSKYYEVDEGVRGSLDASGDGTRVTTAAFAQYIAQPHDAVRISLGARADWLDDSFDGKGASHGALSPKLGLNLRLSPYVHAYAAASRSFKAPTLDQLFDVRTIPVPFPPFSVTTSNDQLVPQYGTNYEVGVYHGQGNLTTSLSIYQMDMKDELDFDVQSLRYVNIGRSRHRGIEIAGRYEPRPGASVFMNRTWQWVRARSGENSGKHLKAIPRQMVSAGFTVRPVPALDIGAAYTEQRGMFLDDANTRPLNTVSRLDAQGSYRIGRDVSLTLEMVNAFRNEYVTTGFPDPAGGDDAYFYPAASRSFRFGMRYGW